MNREELKAIIENVLKEVNTQEVAKRGCTDGVQCAQQAPDTAAEVAEAAQTIEVASSTEVPKKQEVADDQPICPEARCTCAANQIEDGELEDVTTMDIIEQYLYENPYDKEGYMELKRFSPCRLAIGKAGARYKTLPQLQFRAAHSAAQDAVFSDVDGEIISSLDLETFQSRCENKDMYLTRPDLGRRLDEESAERLREKHEKNKQVYIFAADGLSSAAVEANTKEVMASLLQGLSSEGISFGKPFFVKYGRVGVMDEVSEITGADVTCVLIGERPGLITATSMSAYIAYKGTIGMPEARRTVVSNIHSKGTIPAEAGAHVAEVIKTILENKASGLDLKL